MNRRKFIALLSCIPFAGKWLAPPIPSYKDGQVIWYSYELKPMILDSEAEFTYTVRLNKPIDYE